jgi:hypothetical protein
MEKTQEQIDRMRNLVWQNGKLIEQNQQLNEQNQQLLDMIASQDDSVLVAEIRNAKKEIAEAINAKGGVSSDSASFEELVEEIRNLASSGITSEGVVQTEPFSFLDYCCNNDFDKITEINDNTITEINKQYAFYGSNFVAIAMYELLSITGSNAFVQCKKNKKVTFPKLNTIGKSCFQGNVALEQTIIPNLEIIESSAFQQCENLLEHKYPKAYSLGASCFLNNAKCKRIEVGKVTNFNNVFTNDNSNLEEFIIGQDTDVNIQLQSWVATNVINKGSEAIAMLNENLYNGILTKLYDHSTDGVTRTLRLGWYNYVSEENKQYATAKG